MQGAEAAVYHMIMGLLQTAATSRLVGMLNLYATTAVRSIDSAADIFA